MLKQELDDLNEVMPQASAKFGAYTPKGDKAVSRVMISFVKKLIKLEEEKVGCSPSIGERLVAAEKAIAKFREADDKHPNEGLLDTDTRDRVHGFIAKALEASGLTRELIREFLEEQSL